MTTKTAVAAAAKGSKAPAKKAPVAKKAPAKRSATKKAAAPAGEKKPRKLGAVQAFNKKIRESGKVYYNSRAGRYKNATPEGRKLVKAAVKHNTGKKRSADTKKKIRAGVLKAWRTGVTKAGNKALFGKKRAKGSKTPNKRLKIRVSSASQVKKILDAARKARAAERKPAAGGAKKPAAKKPAAKKPAAKKAPAAKKPAARKPAAAKKAPAKKAPAKSGRRNVSI